MALEVERHLHFVAQHLADRNPRPSRDDLADQGAVHHDGHERRLPLQDLELGREPGELRSQGVRGPASTVRCLAGEPLQAFACAADLRDEIALALPPRLQRRHTGLGFRRPLGQLPQPLRMVRADCAFPFEHAGLDPEIVQRAHGVLERRG